MADLNELPPGLRLVVPAEIGPEARDKAIWDSLNRMAEFDEGEGVHDPEVWHAIQEPDPEHPAETFYVEVNTGRTKVIPKLGEEGIKLLIKREKEKEKQLTG